MHRRDITALSLGIGLLSVIVMVFAWNTIRDSRTAVTDKHGKPPVVRATDPVRGSDTPSLTIIEYGDFQCPECGSIEPALQTVIARHPTVRFVWKDFPLTDTHPEAQAAAEAARCAQQQGKFWEMHDALFAHQQQLGDALYTQLALQLQLDTLQFSTCRSQHQTQQLVRQGSADALAWKVDGTPYFFVGNSALANVTTADTLEQALAQVLP